MNSCFYTCRKRLFRLNIQVPGTICKFLRKFTTKTRKWRHLFVTLLLILNKVRHLFGNTDSEYTWNVYLSHRPSNERPNYIRFNSRIHFSVFIVDLQHYWNIAVFKNGSNSSFRCFVLRNSCKNLFYKIGVLKNFTKFTGKHLYQRLFFNKVAGLNFAKFSKTSFL